MATPLQGTESAANAIVRVKYSHDGMIDLLLGNPMISQGQLAQTFGYTEAWVSRVINSDAFQARLAERKTELLDPVIAFSLEEKLKASMDKSLDILQQKLTTLPSADMALEVLKVTSKALGYGARNNTPAVQNNFVIALPQKAASAEEWASAHLPSPSPSLTPAPIPVAGEVIEH